MESDITMPKTRCARDSDWCDDVICREGGIDCPNAEPDPSAYPWKVVNDDYPTAVRTPGGEILHFEDLLVEGQRVGHGDGEGNVYPPYGRVVRRDDGLWIVPEADYPGPLIDHTAVDVAEGDAR